MQEDLTAAMTAIVIVDSDNDSNPTPPRSTPALVIGTLQVKEEPASTIGVTSTSLAAAAELAATPDTGAMDKESETEAPQLQMECESDQPSDATSQQVSPSPTP